MKVLTFSVLVLGAAACARPLAARPQLHLDAGVTTIDLGSQRAAINESNNSAKKAGANVTHKEETTAPFVDLGIDFLIKDQFTVGPQIGYIAGSEDRSTISSGGFDYSSSFTPGMIPVLVKFGWQGQAEEDSGIYGGATLGFGYGIAWMNSKVASFANYDYSYAAGGLIYDLGGRFGYHWKHFSVGLGLGYRYAYFSDMTLVSTTDPGAKTGEKSKDAAGSVEPVNFSGIKGNLELGIRF